MISESESNTKTNKDTGSPSFYLGREIKQLKTFKREGVFKSLYEAQGWCRESGYVYGSLCRDLPIALKKGLNFDSYNLPQKWKNMDEEDIESVDGVVLSEDFREGSVTVILF